MFLRPYNFYDLFEEYKLTARAKGFSKKTIRTTEINLKMIDGFISLKTPVRKFSERDYESFLVALRGSEYSPETIYDLNATLRKLINLAARRGIIKNNFLKTVDNLSLAREKIYNLVSKTDFLMLLNYFSERKEDEFYFFFTLLYYTGIRIGEALALEYKDFFLLKNKKTGKVLVNKSFLYEFKITKETKNKKSRIIPLPPEVVIGFRRYLKIVKNPKGKIFNFSPAGANIALKRVARETGISRYNCHIFRHTYISNLIKKGVPLPVISYVSGDTQKTILSRYSHMFYRDEELVLKAFSDT